MPSEPSSAVTDASPEADDRAREPAALLIEAFGKDESQSAVRGQLVEAARERLKSPVAYARASRALSTWLNELKKEARAAADTKVYVTGNCTLRPLAEAMHVELFSHGIGTVAAEGEFDQWALDMHDPASALYSFDPSVVVIYLCSLGLTQAATTSSWKQLEDLQQGLIEFRKRSSAPVVIVLPEQLEEELDPTSAFVEWRRRAHTMISELAVEIEGLTTIDPAPVLAKVGQATWFAPRFWYHGKFPCHPNALLALGRTVADTLRCLLERPVKVIACDLDNTLWGGVVGEDGRDGLELDVHGAGAPFLRLQAFLKHLAERGVLLVAVSKNNEEDVREVFEKRSEMLLALEDFTAVRANWRPKADNLLELADELRLSLRHFCFLDDSPAERAEVRHRLPAVVVPEMPEMAEDYVPFLAGSGLFQTPVVTEEDRRRSGYYAAETARQTAERATASFDDFLATLELRAQALPVSRPNIQRVAQLLGKTNQFNLTTRRHQADRVRELADDGDVYSFCFQVRDRFGDSGVTGVLIAVPVPGSDRAGNAPDGYEIDTWLLSCRVLGRTIENAMFDHLCSWLRERGVQRLAGRFIPTAKNAPVRDLLPRLGFDRTAELADGVTEYGLAPIPETTDNRFVELTSAPIESR